MNEIVLAITCFILGTIFGIFVRGLGRILLSIFLAAMFLLFLITLYKLTSLAYLIALAVFSFVLAIKKVNSNVRNYRKN